MGAMVAGWSEQEQVIARKAFESAYSRTIESLILSVRIHTTQLTCQEDIWRLHDYLSTQRHSIEGRFDYRLEGILFLFASLVKEGVLTLDELEGLTEDKLAKISAMARF